MLGLVPGFSSKPPAAVLAVIPSVMTRRQGASNIAIPMPRSAHQEDVPWTPPWIRLRRRFGAAAASIVILFMTWETAPGNAAGPLYSVPSHPPPVAESVGFTNALNHRVRHLPTPLNPSAAHSPALVEARVQVLERGVVIERGSRQAKVHSGTAVETNGDRVLVAEEPGDRAPLSMAFIAAGALALLGLLLGVRGKYSGPVRQA